MSNKNETSSCVVCTSSEEEIPVISITYKYNRTWVCFSCLPQLLHGKKDINDYI